MVLARLAAATAAAAAPGGARATRCSRRALSTVKDASSGKIDLGKVEGAEGAEEPALQPEWRCAAARREGWTGPRGCLHALFVAFLVSRSLERRLSARVTRSLGDGPDGRKNLKRSEEDYWWVEGMGLGRRLYRSCTSFMRASQCVQPRIRASAGVYGGPGGMTASSGVIQVQEAKFGK